MAVITLLTDFGMADGYVGIMKGVILGICSDAVIVDIAHDVPRHDITMASLVLGSAWRYFPRGTVHIAVVDPGVGSARRPLALRADGHYFAGPDNGLFTMVIDDAREWIAVELTKTEYFLPRRGQTFHGRDVFAPVAARIATGARLDDLGQRITDPIRLAVLRPERSEDMVRGHVVYIDAFGNLVTNIRAEDIAGAESDVRFEIGRYVVRSVSGSYADAGEGELLAIVGSWGMIEIAANRGSARDRTGARSGDPVVAHLEPEVPTLPEPDSGRR
ncbi:MAG: S-adenosyl-l-methionine hydroxide adenosyltransferase family protein [Armatimonadota bacterium]